MEDWAEIRRLHRSDGVPIKEIAGRLGVARNTVRAALSSDRPPQYRRPLRGSVVDAYEPQIRALCRRSPNSRDRRQLLKEWPRMPAPVIAGRIGWPSSYSDGPLKNLLARIRPDYKGIDPVDRVSYEPGELAQCDLLIREPDVSRSSRHVVIDEQLAAR